MKELGPGGALQRVENGKAGVAEPTREFERPDAVLVHDGVEVDVTAIAAVPQQPLHAPEGEAVESRRALVGDDRSHLAGEFAKVAGKEALVLPVETRRGQKFLAVEIRPDTHLDAFDMLHQDEAFARRREPGEKGDDIASVIQLADERAATFVEFHNVAARTSP